MSTNCNVYVGVVETEGECNHQVITNINVLAVILAHDNDLCYNF